jgi:hypothetical protein
MAAAGLIAKILPMLMDMLGGSKEKDKEQSSGLIGGKQSLSQPPELSFRQMPSYGDNVNTMLQKYRGF